MAHQMLKVLGYTMMGVSALGFVGVFTKPPSSPFGAAFILALIAAGGVGLVWPRKVAGGSAVVADVALEHAVLKTARSLKGRVTVAEVAADTGLPMARVDAELRRMERSNVCASLVGESGILVYLFAEFEDVDAKKDIFAGDAEQRAAAAQASRRQST